MWLSVSGQKKTTNVKKKEKKTELAVLLWLKFCAILRIAVKHQSNEEDDEEMMRVPEHLKV